MAYHPSDEEVGRLQSCLSTLPEDIGYAVVANEHRAGEPVDLLAPSAILFLPLATNTGYGRAVNAVVRDLATNGTIPPFLGALNTDLAWEPGSIETLLDWLGTHHEVVLAVPRLLDPAGREQHLCKQHPTILGLFSRRFMPERIKPAWLRSYDHWYVMADCDYSQVFDVPYLSGCCMLMRSAAFMAVGGFDESFFLYLEDADLTRSMARLGRTVHLPLAPVIHHWGRGNHSSLRLTFVNLHSAWLYFSKWGWKFR